MKNVLIATIALIAGAASAQASAEIASIDCVASNGVTLKGTAEAGSALTVHTQWGVFKKDFTGSIAETSTADNLVVSLDDGKGTSYALTLATAGKPVRASEERKLSGLLQKPVRGHQPAPVAFVACKVSVR